MKSIVKLDTPLVSPPSDFKGDFFKGMTHTLLTTDSYFLHFCRLVVFAAHVVHTVDVGMFVVYLSVFLNFNFFNQLLSHMVIVFFFYRNSNWISRCWPHKCGGQIWHTITRQR